MNLPRARGRTSVERQVGALARETSGMIAEAIGPSVVVWLAGGAMATPAHLRRDLPIARRRHAREPLDRPPQSLPEGHSGGPSEPRLGLPNVRLPARRVILGHREMNELQAAPDERGDGVG